MDTYIMRTTIKPPSSESALESSNFFSIFLVVALEILYALKVKVFKGRRRLD